MVASYYKPCGTVTVGSEGFRARCVYVCVRERGEMDEVWWLAIISLMDIVSIGSMRSSCFPREGERDG